METYLEDIIVRSVKKTADEQVRFINIAPPDIENMLRLHLEHP